MDLLRAFDEHVWFWWPQGQQSTSARCCLPMGTAGFHITILPCSSHAHRNSQPAWLQASPLLQRAQARRRHQGWAWPSAAEVAPRSEAAPASGQHINCKLWRLMQGYATAVSKKSHWQLPKHHPSPQRGGRWLRRR